jgi:quinol monooxygenase YgiN
VYGTVARMKIQREKVDELRALMESVLDRPVEGFRGSHVLIPDDGRDEIVMVAFFDDKATYTKNADDPRMHEDYLKYRALLDADPEWTDGEWITYEA